MPLTVMSTLTYNSSKCSGEANGDLWRERYLWRSRCTSYRTQTRPPLEWWWLLTECPSLRRKTSAATPPPSQPPLPHSLREMKITV